MTIAIAILVATIGITMTTAAFAQGKLPESGFGKASKDLATSEPGATGEHSRAGSDFVGSPPDFNNDVDPSDVPGREGIGNVARPGSVGELGCALDELAGFGGC